MAVVEIICQMAKQAQQFDNHIQYLNQLAKVSIELQEFKGEELARKIQEYKELVGNHRWCRVVPDEVIYNLDNELAMTILRRLDRELIISQFTCMRSARLRRMTNIELIIQYADRPQYDRLLLRLQDGIKMCNIDTENHISKLEEWFESLQTSNSLRELIQQYRQLGESNLDVSMEIEAILQDAEPTVDEISQSIPATQ